MSKNQQQWQLASHYLPGGVCSSARIHNGLRSPFYISRAEGSKDIIAEGVYEQAEAPAAPF